MKSNGDQDCHDCSRWKRVMARQRRIHSLESLLIACGTACGLSSIKRGVIFVHSDDKATTTSVTRKVEGKRSRIRTQIFVFKCSSERLTYNDALFVF
jgi:hypothetical protein